MLFIPFFIFSCYSKYNGWFGCKINMCILQCFGGYCACGHCTTIHTHKCQLTLWDIFSFLIIHGKVNSVFDYFSCTICWGLPTQMCTMLILNKKIFRWKSLSRIINIWNIKIYSPYFRETRKSTESLSKFPFHWLNWLFSYVECYICKKIYVCFVKR